MTPELFEELFNTWSSKELKHQKNNKRKYLHFDRLINIQRNADSLKVFLAQSQVKVPKHAFYPFIRYDIVTPRLKRKTDPKTKQEFLYREPKPREIYYSSHFDSIIYSWYSTILTYHYKQKLHDLKIEDCVLAYLEKDKKCNIDFAQEVFRHITNLYKESGDCVAMTFDLKSFFDKIDHNILKEKWCKILNINNSKLPKDHFTIYKSLTDYTYVKRENLEVLFPIPLEANIKTRRICAPQQFRTYVEKGNLIEKNNHFNDLCNSRKYGAKCGIPQGSTISACLSNIYMIDFDYNVNNETKNRSALYRRYSDDLIIICKKEDWKYFYELLSISIQECEIKMNDDKTEIVFFRVDSKNKLRGFSEESGEKYKNLQYLGFEFNGQNTYIRSSSMSRYARKMSSHVEQTLLDAYCDEFGQKDIIFRKKLYKRFTDKGARNFVAYAKRAVDKMNSSKTINNQVKNSCKKIEKLIDWKREKIENNLKIAGTLKKTML